MTTTKTTAEAERVRLKWEPVEHLDQAFVGESLCARLTVDGVLGIEGILSGGPSKPWLGAVSANGYWSKTFDTKEEAQLLCESVFTGLLLRDLGNVLGENWTDAPGKTRLRLVMDIEADDVTGEHDHRAIHSFVIDRNTQEIRRMHANECTTNEGKPCSCVLNSTASVGVEVSHA